MDPIADSSHWIMRVIGGVVVAGLAYGALTFLSHLEPRIEFAVGISAALGIVTTLFGWKAVRWIINIWEEIF